MIKIKSDKIVLTDRLFDGYLYIDDGKIFDLSKEDKIADCFYDYTNKYVAPGFIDIHTHGGGGFAFMNSSIDDVINGVNFHLRHGTTTILPTVSAGEFDTMKKATLNIIEAKNSKKTLANILGAHLEGPYLSRNQAGAQCPTFITSPNDKDYVPFVNEYKDGISRWTYAPENDNEAKFCRFLTDNNIIASAGHSDAKYQDMNVSIDNGCNLITHLYSCTSTVTRDHGFRSLGIIESAFLRDELFVEIIADGKHLPPDLVKMIVKIKGMDKVILITDSLDIAGTNIKEGVMSGTEFIVEDGVCKLKDRSAFAGSVATADSLIRNLVNLCGFDIPSAVKMLTEVPAKLLNINKGKIQTNYDADVVVFDQNFEISDVFVGGIKKV